MLLIAILIGSLIYLAFKHTTVRRTFAAAGVVCGAIAGIVAVLTHGHELSQILGLQFPFLQNNRIDTALLRMLVEEAIDHSSQSDRDAVRLFYRARSFKPLWILNGKLTKQAEAAVQYLKQLDTEGLDPADFTVPYLNSSPAPAELANAELQLTNSLLTFVRIAQHGQIDWLQVSPNIYYE